MLFDIGGGSTEVVWLDRVETDDGGPPAAIIRAWVSVPLGVVSVAERHGGVQVTAADFEAMVAEFQPHLEGFVAAVGPHDCGRLHLLGTSGTVTTIAGVHLDLPRYDRAQVDGTWLGAGQVKTVVDRLLAMPFSERVANPCIGAERAGSGAGRLRHIGSGAPRLPPATGCALPIAACARAYWWN